MSKNLLKGILLKTRNGVKFFSTGYFLFLGKFQYSNFLGISYFFSIQYPSFLFFWKFKTQFFSRNLNKQPHFSCPTMLHKQVTVCKLVISTKWRLIFKHLRSTITRYMKWYHWVQYTFPFLHQNWALSSLFLIS